MRLKSFTKLKCQNVSLETYNSTYPCCMSPTSIPQSLLFSNISFQDNCGRPTEISTEPVCLAEMEYYDDTFNLP